MRLFSLSFYFEEKRFGIFTPIVILLLSVSAFAENNLNLPESDGQVHLGVASCASSVCHGSLLERKATSVLQNEFVTWSRHDRHAMAYQTLFSKESETIAKNLGLASAHEAKICLDCHADNVSSEFRGPAFDLSDGVGCESCHGGAQGWIDEHVAVSRTKNSKPYSGLYPSHETKAMARLCLSCHLGTQSKLANHQIMGAGHPRLSFELVTFLELMPPHWLKDGDYEKRKGMTQHVEIWVVGQLQAARKTLELIEQHLVTSESIVPELVLFDCHACHHPMSEQRWAPFPMIDGVSPGALRINLAALGFLVPISSSIEPESGDQITELLKQLNRTVQKSRMVTSAVVRDLKGIVDNLEKQLDEGRPLSQRTLLHSLVDSAARGAFRDYALAEQAAMAMNLLFEDLDLWDASREGMRQVFESLADDEAYVPEEFANQAGALEIILQR